MLKIIIGFTIALAIGAACRYFDVPVPAPPKLLGALLIVAITVGYLGTDWVLARQGRSPEVSGNASSSLPNPDAPR